ncbi:hypothetical protein [Mesorhizobium kowhaii]|uniref:hypothetical protein n=1 Tax=Mesorhizobium kowhaii TaxID=1300272 RepID=UPI0011B3EC14|nr:hypothetical protein [Mesorhizobium kowhaii]
MADVECHIRSMEKDFCEMESGIGVWAPIEVYQALELNPDRRKRCPECHGAVRAHREGNNGMRAHFEHIEGHDGCSLKPRTFSGTKSMHPDALS